MGRVAAVRVCLGLLVSPWSPLPPPHPPGLQGHLLPSVTRPKAGPPPLWPGSQPLLDAFPPGLLPPPPPRRLALCPHLRSVLSLGGDPTGPCLLALQTPQTPPQPAEPLLVPSTCARFVLHAQKCGATCDLSLHWPLPTRVVSLYGWGDGS